MKAAQRFDGPGEIRLPRDEDAHGGGRLRGSQADAGHLARNLAAEAGSGDRMGPGTWPLDAADVGGDLVEGVTDLDQVPARLGQGRDVQYDGSVAQIQPAIRVDGAVVGRDGERVP